MKNITKKIQMLEGEDGKLSVVDYIVGYRFTIQVTPENIKMDQDKDFNLKLTGNTLELTEFWDKIANIYRIDSERLHYAPISSYTLFCIFFDQDLMTKLNVLPKYSGKGIVIVNVRNDTSGFYLSTTKLEEFCTNIQMPFLKPIFVGEVSQLKSNIDEVKSTSTFSANRIPHALIIKHDPPRLDENKELIHWMIDSDQTKAFVDGSDTPEAMAMELCGVRLSPELIISIEETTGINPIRKKASFRKAVLKTIKDEYIDEYNLYLDRCSFFLGDNKEVQFDNYINDQIAIYIRDRVSKMDRYKRR